MELGSNAKAKEVSIEAVVIRKDGTVEKLGTVSYWNVNPLRRALHKIKR